MKTFSQRVLSCLREAIGDGPQPLHAPSFVGNELPYLTDCVESTMVSSVGEYTQRFEQSLIEITGARHAVAVVNGTAALQLALILAGVEVGDEVLVPALSFVATANAVTYCGAIPHFVDSNERSLGMDPDALRAWLTVSTNQKFDNTYNTSTDRRIRAIIPMHTFGHPCDMSGLQAVAREFNLIIVEDAAESLGSFYRGGHTGTFGLLGVLSFNGNKIVTTGGGGAILTNSPALAHRARHLATTARNSHAWAFAHDEIGFNFRMPALNAALGCGQLEQLPEFLASKRRLHGAYRRAFQGFYGASIFEEPKGCHSNYWLQTLILAPEMLGEQEQILMTVNDAGYSSRPAWEILSDSLPYRDCPRAPLPIATSLVTRIVNLPSSAGLA